MQDQESNHARIWNRPLFAGTMHAAQNIFVGSILFLVGCLQDFFSSGTTHPNELIFSDLV